MPSRSFDQTFLRYMTLEVPKLKQQVCDFRVHLDQIDQLFYSCLCI